APATPAGHQPKRHEQHQPASPTTALSVGLKKPSALSKAQIHRIGIVQDITDAKLAQEALQTTSAELERRASELQQLALRTAAEPPTTPYAPLTPRQIEILQLIAQGLTNAAIGERLFLTEGTIKWHVQQILTKTNTNNRAEAVARVLGTPHT
ncbi:MAG: response regulator transcription factor, partial [Solirubrobacteraceae bacterium]